MVQEEVVVVQEGEAVNIWKWKKETTKHENLTILCATLNIITTVYIETERELKQL